MANQPQCFPRDGSPTRDHTLEDWTWQDDPHFTHVCDSCGHHAHINRSDGTIIQTLGLCQCAGVAGNELRGWEFPGMSGAEILEMEGERWDDDY